MQLWMLTRTSSPYTILCIHNISSSYYEYYYVFFSPEGSMATPKNRLHDPLLRPDPLVENSWFKLWSDMVFSRKSGSVHSVFDRNIRNLNKINERELELGLAGSATSWHAQYKNSAWVFVGGLPYDLTEGDVICVFSQWVLNLFVLNSLELLIVPPLHYEEMIQLLFFRYGEIVNVNLVRDKSTGKFKGYGFVCYEDQRSTILAVDNFNGIRVRPQTLL